ncbi:MAG: urate hydroxylase PuuD [Deltaproteobacteria bacterium]|nr:urate hydroxylase PuuD [Deltaproteobacteria bacterium]MBI2209857.1 urate hydroxylase PuuD [Deltaproteobacteria bacterium]MBI2348244.1 urate hydroxylase PuuD [Deltaproteobacteria bacterium]MBI2990809.1 urate hydroxylase PuuD [Deltaproteobacteria bacterium]MBI3062836.1 urate hydroxylase PuuD [Deltaproteobacteria bacterium]
MELWLFLLRWIHFLAGITWIGLLYYFNFVQTPFFAETEPAVRSGAIQKLVPRALWWFRWGAMVTFLAGILIYLHKLAQAGVAGFYSTSYGWAITVGGLLGTIMFLNVWLVIWPKQKVVIASATQVAQGGQAIPEAAACGRRAALASRTNTLFSIPMLFYMGAASHLTLFGEASAGGIAGLIVVGGIIIAAVEANALVGSQGPTKKPLDTVSGTLWAGFILAAIFHLLFVILF